MARRERVLALLRRPKFWSWAAAAAAVAGVTVSPEVRGLIMQAVPVVLDLVAP
jgi:hypothetical protein